MAETLYPRPLGSRLEEKLIIKEVNYNRATRNESTVAVKVMCALVFVVFSFLWLYFFQSDVMYVTQHALSGGQTRYDRLWGAVLITLVLALLQVGIYSLTRLSKRAHALTWFPSMLLLAVLTSAGPDVDLHFTFGPWLWLFPLLIVLWGGSVWMAGNVESYDSSTDSGLFSRRMWINLLTMALMACGVASCSNTNAVFHFRAHAEVALLRGDAKEALRVGQRSLETDGHLMMVRMYALSRQGLLGERLFDYPLVPSSDMMLPMTPAATRLLIYPADSLYRHLGAIPRPGMTPMDYLHAIFRTGQAKPAAVDYLLCGYLIDRDLDSFASEISCYYTVNDSLPRYYREALVLYTHQRNKPVLVYHDPVLDVDYQDLRKLEAEYPSENERKGKVMEKYANSYWYYYDYVKP